MLKRKSVRTGMIIVILLAIAAGGLIVWTRHHDAASKQAEATSKLDSPGRGRGQMINNKTDSNGVAASGDTAANGSTSGSGSASTPTNPQTFTIKSNTFTPASLTVKKGTAVTWSNQDSVTHAIAEKDSQDGPRSPQLAATATYTYTYNTVGTFQFYCVIHPDMVGTVTVTE